nr:hypothetical protein [Mycobacterium eburneum]
MAQILIEHRCRDSNLRGGGRHCLQTQHRCRGRVEMIVERNARKPHAFGLLGGRGEVVHLNTRGDHSESNDQYLWMSLGVGA